MTMMMGRALLLSLLLLSFASLSLQVGTNWRHCAYEGEYCMVNSNNGGIKQVRYGEEGNWSFVGVKNAGVPCSASFFGDLAPGSIKSCMVSENEIPGPPNDDWVFCAYEGDKCIFDGLRRVRYGISNEYFYLESSGGLPCDHHSIGANPSRIPDATNSCYYSKSVIQSSTDWVKCADNGEDCVLPLTNALYSVRMTGSDDSALAQVRLVSQGTKKVSCSSSVFSNWQGSGASTHCSYLRRPEREFSHISGRWRLYGNCYTTPCNLNLPYGVNSQSSDATSPDWIQNLNETCLEGIGWNHTTMNPSVTETVTQEMQATFARRYAMACKASCPVASVNFWQWVLDAEEVVFSPYSDVTMETSFTSFSCNHLCVTSDHVTPICPPGYCADALCTKCTTQID